eukprot:jgi/Bigna1/80559/fgenesh1_pg.72_\
MAQNPSVGLGQREKATRNSRRDREISARSAWSPRPMIWAILLLAWTPLAEGGLEAEGVCQGCELIIGQTSRHEKGYLVYCVRDGTCTLTSYGSLSELLKDSHFLQQVYQTSYRLNLFPMYFPKIVDEETFKMISDADKRIFGKYGATNRHLFKTIVNGKPEPLGCKERFNEIGPEGLRSTAPIIVNSVQDADESLGGEQGLATLFEASDIGVRPNINMYVSPADRIGLTAHHDPQDVFILQLSGSKIWKVCHPIGGGVELPTRVSDDPSHPLYYRYTDEKLEKEGAKC